MRRTILVMVAFLAACSTSYGRTGLLHPSGGYSERKITEGEWQVRFRSNGYSAPGLALDGALYRAAELARDAGFPYFQVYQRRKVKHTFSINYGPPTYAGETETLWIRGLPAADSEPTCESQGGRDVCRTLSTETVLRELASVVTPRRSNPPAETNGSE